MMGLLFPSPSEGRLLDGGRLSGPTPWVIAIMSFSMMIVAVAGIALANTAGLVARSVDQRYSVQVPDGARELGALLRAVRSAPGVASAESVPEERLRETLERWLGPAASSPELPIPALVYFDIRAGANLDAIAARVKAAVPQANIAAHRQSLGPLLDSLRALQWLALGLVVLLGAAAAAAIVLATRGALDTHRFTIEVMHGIGATDLQVTRLFQRKIAVESLIGSVAGATAAALVLLVLLGGAGFVRDLTGGLALGAGDIAMLMLLPLALTALATVVARMAVLSALRQAL